MGGVSAARDSMGPVVFVCAPNHSWAEHWARESGKPDREWMYVGDDKYLQGVHGGILIVLGPSMTGNMNRVLEYAQQRQMTIVHVNDREKVVGNCAVCRDPINREDIPVGYHTNRFGANCFFLE